MPAPRSIQRCPYCGSQEFWASRKRPLERLLSPLLPFQPLRCRACLKRYFVFEPWAAFVLRYGSIVLIIAAVVVVYFILAPSSESPEQTAEAPATQSPAAPPAAPPKTPPAEAPVAENAPASEKPQPPAETKAPTPESPTNSGALAANQPLEEAEEAATAAPEPPPPPAPAEPIVLWQQGPVSFSFSLDLQKSGGGS